jgi:hypothetical protein
MLFHIIWNIPYGVMDGVIPCFPLWQHECVSVRVSTLRCIIAWVKRNPIIKCVFDENQMNLRPCLDSVQAD